MVHGAKEFAGVPLYWAVARLIGRGGMPALTVRAAAKEAGCSVGFMRHYYDTKTKLLACTYELVVDAQLRRVEEILWARREPTLNPAPPDPLGPERAASLLASCLDLGEDDFLLVVQLSLHAQAQHDGGLGDSVARYHARVKEVCMKILREAGVPPTELETEARDLRALVMGVMALVPGLASDDPETGEPAERLRSLPGEQVEAILRRHLEAAVARHRWTPQVNDR